jgi:hypothetical protein
MDLLPEDLLAGILRRLPVRPLAVCRSVSTHLCAVIDGRGLLAAHLAPRGLRGTFVNDAGQSRPNLISRRAVDAELTSHHINGLLLVQDCEKLYVCNPVRVARGYGKTAHFYPIGILLYEVISVSEEAPCCKPSTMYGPNKVFSTRTGRWEERAYVGEDDAAANVLDVQCNTYAGRDSVSIAVRWFRHEVDQHDVNYVNIVLRFVNELTKNICKSTHFFQERAVLLPDLRKTRSTVAVRPTPRNHFGTPSPALGNRFRCG